MKKTAIALLSAILFIVAGNRANSKGYIKDKKQNTIAIKAPGTITKASGTLHDFTRGPAVHGHVKDNNTGELLPFHVPPPQQLATWPFAVGMIVKFDKICPSANFCYADNITQEIL